MSNLHYRLFYWPLFAFLFPPELVLFFHILSSTSHEQLPREPSNLADIPARTLFPIDPIHLSVGPVEKARMNEDSLFAFSRLFPLVPRALRGSTPLESGGGGSSSSSTNHCNMHKSSGAYQQQQLRLSLASLSFFFGRCSHCQTQRSGR